MQANHPRMVTGAQLRIPFPVSIESLREQGTRFLTAAFRASGAVAADNAVEEITRFEEFFGGGAGRKLRLSVRYARPDSGLHEDLFVKFPRDFGDPLRDLFSHLMESETRLALLSRSADFPVPVPRCYFADYDPASRSGILITECIAYGRDGVEPFRDKCLDDELPDPLGHYRALIRAVAKLAAAHKSGRLGREIDRRFPYERTVLREDDRIPYSAEALDQKLAKLCEFAAHHPNLLPANVADTAFLERFTQEARRFHEHEIAIKRYLNADADYIALCHWNANVDNAWFSRGTNGELEAGLLDWGSAGQMNVAQSLYGALCAVEVGFWNAHKDELVALFAQEYRRHGGPALDVEALGFKMQLFVALLGLAWMIDAPAIIESQIPDLDGVRDRFDPRIRSNFLARAQLQLLTVFLNAWQRGRFGVLLETFHADRPPCQ